MSKPTTSWPTSTALMARGRPTYPCPTTTTFTGATLGVGGSEQGVARATVGYQRGASQVGTEDGGEGDVAGDPEGGRVGEGEGAGGAGRGHGGSHGEGGAGMGPSELGEALVGVAAVGQVPRLLAAYPAYDGGGGVG